MKRVAYKLEMHCQHYRKDLSKKQAEMAAIVQSKKGKKEFTLGVRNSCQKKSGKTDCRPQRIVFSVSSDVKITPNGISEDTE